jgi:hypothetical protein
MGLFIDLLFECPKCKKIKEREWDESDPISVEDLHCGCDMS